MTAGGLDGQRWGRKAGTVLLLLCASTSLDDKREGVGKHKEEKNLQTLDWGCLLLLTDEPKRNKLLPKPI